MQAHLPSNLDDNFFFTKTQGWTKTEVIILYFLRMHTCGLLCCFYMYTIILFHCKTLG